MWSRTSKRIASEDEVGLAGGCMVDVPETPVVKVHESIIALAMSV